MDLRTIVFRRFPDDFRGGWAEVHAPLLVSGIFRGCCFDPRQMQNRQSASNGRRNPSPVWSYSRGTPKRADWLEGLRELRLHSPYSESSPQSEPMDFRTASLPGPQVGPARRYLTVAERSLRRGVL